ncbi:HEAT repeat domain-containing protein [Methanogenium organophilum]|uniref:HEAT repeat domain-containing protein n=1 Tax=Methanogenium organophilum TaxID=2199 RepID=A0A9X9S4R7_METOG|nr:HEAT repeat domain-containing protein [Methanogenium organophilum]WAI01758.1 HEAT repeat domain-containing protein [Methanogenium organophilum]
MAISPEAEETLRRLERTGDREIIQTVMMMIETEMIQDMGEMVHLLMKSEWENRHSLNTTGQALVALGAEAVPACIEAFSDACWGMCFELQRILTVIGPSAEPLLITALKSPDPRVRGYAAETLGEMRAEAALPDLRALFTDPERSVRREASRAIGMMAHTPAGSTLIAATLADPDSRIRRSAIRAVGISEDPLWCWYLATLITTQDCTIRHATTAALGKLGPPAVPLLEKALMDSSGRVRHTAAKGLGNSALTSSIPALAAALADTDPDVREAAAWSLHRIGRPATTVLIRALSHPDNNVRRISADSIGEMKEERAILPLLRTAASWPDSRCRAFTALRRIGAPSALLICTAIADGTISPSLAENALTSIGLQAVDVLCLALWNPDATVQLTAVSSLIRIEENKRKPHCVCDYIGPIRVQRRVGPPQPGLGSRLAPAVPALIILLRHTDPALRRRAAEALELFIDTPPAQTN